MKPYTVLFTVAKVQIVWFRCALIRIIPIPLQRPEGKSTTRKGITRVVFKSRLCLENHHEKYEVPSAVPWVQLTDRRPSRAHLLTHLLSGVPGKDSNEREDHRRV